MKVNITIRTKEIRQIVQDSLAKTTSDRGSYPQILRKSLFFPKDRLCTHAQDTSKSLVKSRVHVLEPGPLHGFATSGGILSATKDRLVTVGFDYFANRSYVTVLDMPQGRYLLLCQENGWVAIQAKP